MKKKTLLLVTTASLYVAFPVFAQGNGNDNGKGHGVGEHQSNGHGHNPHGNGSDHTGPDTDGSGGKGRDDRGGDDHGRDNVILTLVSPQATKAVAIAAATVTQALAAGSFTTSSGVIIPAVAQARAHDVLIAAAPMSPASTELQSALALAGPTSDPAIRALVRSMSGLASSPARLPQAVADYNTFVKSASASFLTHPPAEFVALQAVLVKLTTAAGGK